MPSQVFYTYTVATFIVLTSIVMLRRKKTPEQQSPTRTYPLANVPIEQLPGHIQSLFAKLPECVILQNDVVAFQQAVDYSWAQQSREVVPACIVRPRNTEQLSQTVKLLKLEYDGRSKNGAPNLEFFSIRSGGVNPGLQVSTVQNAVLVDLSLFCEVTPAVDGSTVTIGTGAKWIDVYKALDKKGLTVIGGRNSPVGVGGLTLQGGISLYSSRFGFVCSNAVSYEVVLAGGSIVTASASEHSDLWRVLKGGSNNFGIVTRFTLRSLAAAPVWTSQTIAPAPFQQAKTLELYHNYVAHASQPSGFDENAASPILNFSYIPKLPFQLIALNLVYTKAPEDNKWPVHWKESGFDSLWSFQRTSEVVTHTSVVERFARHSPAGTRHVLATTTIRNNVVTLKALYAIFCETTTAKLRNVQGLRFHLTFQAILPGWMNKGFPNVLGLKECTEPLIIIGCAVTWAEARDDELVRSTIRDFLEQTEAAAAATNSDHPYRFQNYCMDWQRPYEGLGDLKLMKEASQRYDPDGLFQKGRAGGFKLDVVS